MNPIEIKFGYQNFGNFRRLSYKWWYAIAEFIDNSTQSYKDNQHFLDTSFKKSNERLTVRITTDEDFIRIWDNAMGMNIEDLERALIVGMPPDNSTGRGKYGLGMKTAACWIGNTWKIITTKLGDPKEYTVEIDVGAIVQGTVKRPTTNRTVLQDEHYTYIEITDHHRFLRGRTIGMVKKYLSSIYRVDISEGELILKYDDLELEWNRYEDDEFLTGRDGTLYKTDFIFEIPTMPEKKLAEGWVGVLLNGARSKAGFSIFHRKRLIKGWPDSWKPEKLYGAGGRNDLINQRLVGEINLEDFEISHTKDEINWHGEEEELVEEGLKEHCKIYIDEARKTRKGQPPGYGPEQVHVDAAVKALEEELASKEFLEKLALDDVLPPREQIELSNRHVVENAMSAEPEFTASLGDMTVKVFLDAIGSPFDPYYTNEGLEDDEVIIIVNILHPHWSMLEGENSIVNFLRHCVYDGVAEYRAGKKHRLEPDSIKILKDGYLRVTFDILQSDDE